MPCHAKYKLYNALTYIQSTLRLLLLANFTYSLLIRFSPLFFLYFPSFRRLSVCVYQEMVGVRLWCELQPHTERLRTEKKTISIARYVTETNNEQWYASPLQVSSRFSLSLSPPFWSLSCCCFFAFNSFRIQFVLELPCHPANTIYSSFVHNRNQIIKVVQSSDDDLNECCFDFINRIGSETTKLKEAARVFGTEYHITVGLSLFAVYCYDSICNSAP